MNDAVKGGGNYASQINQSKSIRTSLLGISQLLNTGLNPECLDICCQLIEAGVHPQALAEVVIKLREKAAAQQNEVKNSNYK